MCCYNQGNNSKLQSIIPHHTKMSDVKKMDEIYVMKEGQKVDDVLHQIVSSETNQDAFYILDLDDIVQKHQHWMKKMPRVAPFYGKINLCN